MKCSDITHILESGQPDAVEKVMPMIYSELRALASSYLRHERVDHTLQPTALVHELYIKFSEQNVMNAKNRGHLMAIAATCIRQILVDNARRVRAKKRGKDWQRVTLDTPISPSSGNEVDLLDLHGAIEGLGEIDARRARIVEMRIFGGMTGDEIAELLNLSRTSVTKEWRFARAWLSRALT